MSDNLLVLLGSLIIGCAVALLLTYESYKIYVEALMIVLAVTGALLTIYQFLRKKQWTLFVECKTLVSP